MKRGLLGALEELDESNTMFLDDDEDTDTKDTSTIDSALLTIMDAGKEFDDLFDDVDQMRCKKESLEEAIENLENISATIKKYGICRAMMEAVDPRGELVVSGICCSYEELSTAPQHDEKSALALESLSTTVAGIGKSFTEFFKILGHKFNDLMIAIRKMFSAFEGVLNDVYGKVRVANPDLAKFESTNVRALSKDDFDVVMMALNTVFSALSTNLVNEIVNEAARHMVADSENAVARAAIRTKMSDFFKPLIGNETIHKALGITIIANGNDRVGIVKSTRPLLSDNRALVSHLGWRVEDVITGIEQCREIRNKDGLLMNCLTSIEDLCEKMAFANKEYHHETVVSYQHSTDREGNTHTHSSVNKDIVMQYGEFTRSLEEFAYAIFDVSLGIMKGFNNAQSSVLQLARAAIKA